MEWTGYATDIKELLGLKGSPVAITYSMDAPAGAAKGNFRVCDAFIVASQGMVIDLTATSSACTGGTWHLGLGERPKGAADRGLKEFLVNGEKLYCSVGTFYRSQYLTTRPPLGLAEHVVLSPMEKAEFRPDLVLFICNAVQACRLLTLDGYDSGVPPKTEMAGSTCHQAVAYPIVTGELNVILMDYTSRKIKGYRPEDLMVTVPYHKFHGVMRSIDHCTAGRAKMEIPESFRRSVSEETIRGLED